MKKIPRKYYLEEDVLLVHKPIGISSFGLVAKMRKVLGTRKIGHAGTLDPLASGLMILGVNRGTKKINNYLKLDKTYIANIVIGKSTTTGDKEGGIVEEKKPYKKDLKMTYLEDALDSLLGEHWYPAPLYSAVKVLGKPLYKYAREGKEPPFIPEKKMFLKKAYITDFYKSGNYFIVKIRAEVGSGTYIRTLAEEFGKKLGYPASLASLYRVKIDSYCDSSAYRLKRKGELTFYAIMDSIRSLIKKTYADIFPNKKS